MPYVIGTAGHVDHGKSTLVRALTGIDPDRLAEEKAREMTIDLGFAWLTLPSGEPVGIIDVPGHRDFIENMLAGIGGVDLALFVIAADEGVMPQTREHLAILDLLGIVGGVVALTKTDLAPDEDWIDLVMLDLAEVFAGTVLQAAPIVPVSARTGEGLDRLVLALENALMGHPPRLDRGKPRLPVDRVFTISGFGTVVTGTLNEGTFRVGDEVDILPSGKRARIRSLQSHNESVDAVYPGSRVAVNLGGVAVNEIQRGDVIAAPGLLQPTNLVDVSFRHLADAGRPLKHNSEVKFFSGAAETVAHVRLLGDRELIPGAIGWLQLRLTESITLDKGDRFILRYPSPGQTIGGGVVVDPHPAYRWRRFKPEVLDRLVTLAAGSDDERLAQVVEGHTALTHDQAKAISEMDATTFSDALALLDQKGDLLHLSGGWMLTRGSWNRTVDRITRELSAYHTANPLRHGMPREALRSRLEVDTKLFNSLLALAVEEGILSDEGKRIRLAGHSVRFAPHQQDAIDELMRLIQLNPIAPPSVKEVVERVTDEVLQALLEQGHLIQLSEDVLLESATYTQWVQAINTFMIEEGSITVAQARDRLGTTRKYALAILEYLDRIGLTRRVGDERVLKSPVR